MALSLALRMLMLASTAASMQSTMSTRAQPGSRQAAAVVRWRSSRSNRAAASCELAPSASTCLHAGEEAGEELFRLAARLNTKRVQYQPGLYANPYQKDESTVSAIKESFERHRATYVRLLTRRILEERGEQSQEKATKPKAKARRAAKSRATPKRATRAAPPNMASVPS